MNDDVRAFVTWDEDFKDMYESHGHKVVDSNESRRSGANFYG